MKIEQIPYRLLIHFDHPAFKRLEYDREGNVQVFDSNDRIINQFKTPASVAFNAQYGTPISHDGQYVYIGNWERGLFCYSIDEGKQVWKAGPGKVRTIIVFDELLIVEMCDRGIYIRQASDGKLINEIKMSGIESFFQIGENQVFAGPKNNKYYVYEIPTMDVLSTYKMRDLNFNNSISFIINDVFYKDGNLIIKGWERYKNQDVTNDEQTYFERPANSA